MLKDLRTVVAGVPPLSIRNYRPGSWEAWLKEFNDTVHSTPFQNLSEAEKVAMFMEKLGPDMTPISRALNKDLSTISFEDLVERLTLYFYPLYARSVFLNCKQLPHETFEQFSERLNVLSGPCDFGSASAQGKMIRDVFLNNMLGDFDFIRATIYKTCPDPNLRQTIILAENLIPANRSEPPTRSANQAKSHGRLSANVNQTAMNQREPQLIQGPRRSNEFSSLLNDIQPGDTVEVLVHCVENELIYVSPVSFQEMRESFFNELKDSIKRQKIVPEVGHKYSLLFGGMWYRTQVIKTDPNSSKARVKCFDFGWAKTVSFDAFSPLPLDFIVVDPLVLTVSFLDTSSKSIGKDQRLHLRFLHKKNGSWFVSSVGSPEGQNNYSEKNAATKRTGNKAEKNWYANGNKNKRSSKHDSDHSFQEDSDRDSKKNYDSQCSLKNHSNKGNPRQQHTGDDATGHPNRLNLDNKQERSRHGNDSNILCSRVRGSNKMGMVEGAHPESLARSYSQRSEYGTETFSDRMSIPDRPRQSEQSHELSKRSLNGSPQGVNAHIPVEPPIPMDQFTEVRVVYVSPNDVVYVLPNSLIEKHVDLCEQLSERCSDASNQIIVQNLAKGKLCAAPFEGGWYRAKVTSFKLEENVAKVFFLDFGNEEEVSSSQIITLPREIEDVRPLVFPIKLPNSRRVEINDSLEVMPKFQIKSRTWVVSVKDVKNELSQEAVETTESQESGHVKNARTRSDGPKRNSSRIDNQTNGERNNSRHSDATERTHRRATPKIVTEDQEVERVSTRLSSAGSKSSSIPENNGLGLDDATLPNFGKLNLDGNQSTSNASRLTIPFDIYTNVTIAHVSPKGVVYVYPDSVEEKLSEVCEKLDVRYTNISNHAVLPSPAKGAICAAPFEGHWYRAEVLGVKLAQKKVRVLFIDFGNVEVLSTSQIMTLPTELVGMEPLSFPIKVPKSLSLKVDDRLELKPKFQDEDGSWIVSIDGVADDDDDDNRNKAVHESDWSTGATTDCLAQALDTVLRRPHALPIPQNEFTSVTVVYDGPEGTFVVPWSKIKVFIQSCMDVATFEYTSRCVSPTLDTIYAAPFADTMYRAKVVSIDEKTCSCHVVFVDYGNESDVSLDALFDIPDVFSNEVHTFKIRLDPKSGVEIEEDMVLKVSPVALERDGSLFVQIEGEPSSVDYQLPPTDSDIGICFSRNKK